MAKSTVDQIRQRFDGYVENFSDLSRGQRTAVDSTLALELIAQGAARVCPGATSLLDVGCGAGNWTLKLLERLPGLEATLVDLSEPMLARARHRVTEAGAASVACVQSDIRVCTFPPQAFDLIVAGSVLHHLRDDAEWDAVFANFARWLKPGGSVWVYDLISHECPAVSELMTDRYADFLRGVGGAEFQNTVFAYIEEEDTPRPVTWQIDRLRAAGFATVDVLHKSATFAAYVAVR